MIYFWNVLKNIRLVLLGIAFGVIVWVFDAFFESLTLDISLIEKILYPSLYEIIEHLLFIGLFVLLGFYAQNIINKRKQAEESSKKANRALHVLSLCNQSVIHAKKETTLFNEVCHIIVNIGGYRLAWIGFVEHDKSKSVRPVAQAGYEQGYLDTVNITWAETERGQGPTGKAIRTRLPCIAQHILTDPSFKPWREEALKRDYASATSLPLIHNDNVFANLNIYAKESNAFNSEEIILLMELADNLAYGIMMIRMRAEQKQVEQKLKESHKTFVTVLDSLSSLVYVVDLNNYEILFANKQTQNLYGDIVGNICWQAIQKSQSGPCDFCTNKKLLTLNGKPSSLNVREQQNTVTNRMNEIHEQAILWVDGRLARLIIVFDITERKQAELSLQESEKEFRNLSQQFNTLLDAIPDLIILISPDLKVVWANKSAASLADKETTDFKSQQSYKLWLQQAAFLEENPILNTFKTGKMHTAQFINDNGYWEIRVFPVKDDTGKVINVIKVIKDITEKKKIEEKLLKAQKFESIGILAAGVSHNFNNILTGVLSNITLAKLNARSGESILENLTEAEQVILQAKTLSQQLLTFSKDEVLVKEVVSISKLLKATVSFSLKGSNVKSHFSIQKDIYSVLIDANQITQVINNLVLNACDAMPEGGQLQIIAQNVTNEEESLLAPNKKYVKISIKDHGVGIPTKHYQNLFDPYFTTKIKGTGLGLATTYSLIKKHDGIINFDSELGRGTTFNIYLPVSKEKRAKEKELN